MIIALVVTLCLLSVGVVLLFAMMAELWSRLAPLAPLSGVVTAIRPLDEARIGASDIDWPIELSQVPLLADATLVVFSTSCATCREIAGQLSSRGSGGSRLLDSLFIVVSCPQEEIGEDFIQRYSLRDAPHIVDSRGEWTRTQLGVQTSPSALVFRNGRLEKAFTFGSAEALPLNQSGGEREAANDSHAMALASGRNGARAKEAG
jgi:hypothetical protein